MAEVVFVVGGSCSDVQCDQRDHGRDQVHPRLGGIGQEADCPGEKIRRGLQPDR
jgi:hypothetical protein